MRLVSALVALIALAGCESSGSKAERAYRDLSKGDHETACLAARHAQDEYLKEGNSEKFAEMKKVADGECSTVEVLGQARSPR